MNKKALIFLILTIISFFVSLFLNFHKIKIPYFGALYKEIQTDIIFTKKTPSVFYENKQVRNYAKIDENHFLFVPYRYDLVKNINLKNIENIEKLTIYNGNKAIFIDDFKENIKIDNNKNFVDKFTISFLSFFYNPQFYIISYIFLFLFLYNLQFENKKTKISLITLFLLSLIFRIAQINNIPFWDDEIYILSHTNKWLETIQDPGNPPFYFILFKIYRSFVQNPEFYRYSSVIIGLLFNICFYIYLKSIFNKKTALVGLSLVSINIVLIYLSQEIRCYMLLMLLAIINSYLLFKFNKKTKYYFLFSTLALLYTHFYAAFYVLYNFIFGLSIFKNKTKIKNFILINIIAFLGFLPILIYKKTSLINEFNTWMKLPNTGDWTLFINSLFGNTFAFISLIFLIGIFYLKASKKDKLFLRYNFLAFIFILCSALLFTYLIKPIFYYKYFYIIFPNVIILISYICKCFLEKKLGFILVFLLIFSFNFRLNQQNLFCNHNLYLDFIKYDIDKTKNNYIFMSDTTFGYKNFNIKDAKMLYLPINQGIENLDIQKYDIKKPAVIYLLNLYLDDNLLKAAKNIKLYKTPLGVFCKFEL